MAPLNAWVWRIYTTDQAADPQTDTLLVDTGAAGLVAGLIEAFEVRVMNQRSIGVVMADEHCSAQEGPCLSAKGRTAAAGGQLCCWVLQGCQTVVRTERGCSRTTRIAWGTSCRRR